jgi:NitT/TauT family transport system permease protein
MSVKKYSVNFKLNIICTVLSLAILVSAWLVTYAIVRNDYIVPSFTDTLKSSFALFASTDFWLAFLNTFLRTVLAFLISFLLAAVCASLSSLSKIFSAIINPVMIILRALPTLAVVLILLVWTTPKIAPIVICALVLFPMIYAQFMAAIGEIDGGLKDMAQVYNIPKKDRLFKIYLPQVAQNALAQVGANLSLGLKVMISAEVIANTAKSLGGMMSYARAYLEMPRLAALTFVAIILGFIFELGLGALTKITQRWK